jgi:SET domain-containing protein
MKQIFLFFIFSIILLSCTKKVSQDKPRIDLLEVKESEIPGAGKGLFAKQDIPVGTYLGAYSGKKITEREANRLRKAKKDHYFFGLPNCSLNLPQNIGYSIINGDPEHYISKVNFAPRSINNEEVEFINVAFLEFCTEPHIRLYAIEEIKAGEELYATYGEDGYDYDSFMQIKEVQEFFLNKANIQIPSKSKFSFSP